MAAMTLSRQGRRYAVSAEFLAKDQAGVTYEWSTQ